MCGRFVYFGNGTFGYESLLLTDPPHIEDYNIPPSRNILTIRTSPESGKPDYAILRWGLVPFWSKTPKTKYLLNNARAEGIEKKPSFRGPIKHRRCIIPASGFYEWLRKGGQKTPYFVRRTDGGYLAMGGIWDHWQSDDGQKVDSCSIITTEANPYGNAAAIYTSSGQAAQHFVEHADAGMIGVNIGVPVPREPFAFGGWNRDREIKRASDEGDRDHCPKVG